LGWPDSAPHGIDIIVSKSPTSAAVPYAFAVGVDPGDIDFMGHVNNASYLKWVQDAVIDHWRSLAPADAVAGHLWVALKHEITYRRPTFLGDDVIATVLLEKVQGARAFYETIIRRGEDVLAEVKSSWCCIDVATMRPARLAREIIEKFFPEAV
jgi:acyl-CoA thioester hydrolase